MKPFFIVFLISVFFVSCEWKPQNGQHNSISFYNSSADTVYAVVFYHEIKGGIITSTYDAGLHLPDKYLMIEPGIINSEALPLTDRFTYEELFASITDSIVVYVLPKDYDGVTLYNDAKLISYYLRHEDLIRLDWTLAYPPDERMKGIKTIIL